jgi:hypothetical protein
LSSSLFPTFVLTCLASQLAPSSCCLPLISSLSRLPEGTPPPLVPLPSPFLLSEFAVAEVDASDAQSLPPTICALSPDVFSSSKRRSKLPPRPSGAALIPTRFREGREDDATEKTV